MADLGVFRCVDQNGGFMVETTAWEGKKGG
jgi:hypothetical protein